MDRAPAARSTDGGIRIEQLIGWGIVMLPLGGALKLIGNIGTFDSIGWGIPTDAEAATVASPWFVAGQTVGSVLPTVLGLFGVFALFGHLVRAGARRGVLAGLVCTVTGSGATLLGLGVVSFAVPALGDAYRAGLRPAMDIADSFLVWPRGAMFYPAVLYPIGLACFAYAIWRSGVLPRASGVLLAASGVLIAVPVPLHSVRLAGGVLGLAAGAWIAHLVRHCGSTPSAAVDRAPGTAPADGWSAR